MASRGANWGRLRTRVVAAGLCLFSRVARAADPAASADCPTAEALETAVRALLSRSSPGAQSIDLAMEVLDLGDRYAVTVRGRTREYTDPARDCAQRARVAAVFVALTLAPPEIGLPDTSAEPEAGPPPPEPAPRQRSAELSPTPPAVNPVPAPVASSWWPEIELGARGALAPRSDGTTPFAAGPELRLVLTGKHWGITLGGSVLTSSSLDLDGLNVRQARYPMDLGLRLGWGTRWLRSCLDLGGQLAVLRLRSTHVLHGVTVTRVEPGLRMAVTVSPHVAWVAPYLRGSAEVVPVTHRIAVEPTGPVGRTPALWVGLAAGLAGIFD